MSSSESSRRVASGMRPTGRLHLGHYHGVIKNWGRASAPIRMLFLRRRLARADHRLPRHRRCRTAHGRHGGRLAGGGRRPGRRDDLHSVEGAGACRAAPAAVDDFAGGLAGARADLQGHAGEALRPRPGHLRVPRLPRAAGGRHSHLSRRQRAGRGGPGRAPRTGSGNCAGGSIMSSAASRASRNRRRQP